MEALADLVQHHVGRVGLEELGCQLTGLVDDLPRGLMGGHSPTWSDREPKVPTPRGTTSVSPCTTSMASIGMPSASLTSMAQDVTWPCPCGDVPVRTTAVPFSCTSTAAYSPPGTPLVIST